MKRILAIVLAFLMVFAMAACDNGSDSGNTDKPAESGNAANQQTTENNAKTDPAGKDTAAPADHPVLTLCGLTVEDIEAGVTTLGEGFLETGSGFVGVMSPAELNFASFESWLNALAANCRKAAKDGKLYESEASTEELSSFTLDSNALMNVVLFIYRTNNKVVCVTASFAVTGNAFSCKLEVY